MNQRGFRWWEWGLIALAFAAWIAAVCAWFPSHLPLPA